jgi:leucyl-tRNA synthetase
MAYNHQSIEAKWQKFWEENQVFAVSEDTAKPKKYLLDMFPYPSGAGLHVGHPKGFTATDILARYYHATGHNVLHPMGFDAFGLPAENYAIKTGTHPAITTAENVQTFISQLKNLGFSYDWNRMVDTTDPEYYRWTQWIFLELFKRGLAYEQDLPINYCPSCKTWLANEEVLSDNTCDRCGTKVERRPIRQWVLRITEYADRLLSDIDDLDWPEGIKEMQRNWIGKSEGCEFEMKKSDDASKSIRVYTTRVDTVYGMTYAVLAPDHPHVDDFITLEQRSACEAYIADAKSKSDQDRTADNKEKTGVWTGSYVVNPYNWESVPLWIADYVLGHYGTGAVMAVPAHDERDGEFARKYDLPIIQSIATEYTLTGEAGPKQWVDTLKRKVIDVILENENGEFLLLEEQNPYSCHFIGWGIEESESEDEAILKEIREESGYCDIEIVQKIPGTFFHAIWYRHSKEKNQDTLGQFIHVRLLSDNRVDSEVEEGKHTMNWYTHDEISKKITWWHHALAWKIFQLAEFEWITSDGILVNSWEYSGLFSAEARRILTEKAESEGFGSKKINYKLRDWLFSRQRYWGEPIPLIHISHEDYMALPRVKKIEDAKVGEASILSSWGTKDLLGNGADSSHTRNDKNGPTESLIIDGKIFSDIYDGITGKIIIDSRLPITLPEVERYEPAGDGQSPLATVPAWVNVKIADNLNGKRETNTMPQWGGSCWYYLRYMDNKNSAALASKDALDYWGIVDEYVGGAEHAVLHLLYARFWHKVLYDAGIVPTKEPFQKLTNVGMILAYAYERADGGLVAVDLVEERDGKFFERETGKEVKQVVAKMSKSLKNVVNPNEIVEQYGADTLRLYEMNMAWFTDTAPWNPEAIVGVRRFLDKTYSAFTEGENIAKDDMKAMKLLHKTIKKVGEDIVGYKFNTAISALMILLNEGIPTDAEFASEWKEKFAILLHPFAPHMAEELYCLLLKGGAEERGGGFSETQEILSPSDSSFQKEPPSIYNAPWPEYDEFMLVDDEVTIAVQVNGKLRGTLTCFNWVAQEEVSLLAHDTPDIAKWLEWKTLVKEIFIPNKMLSIVVKD